MRLGTGYFVDFAAARRYYQRQGEPDPDLATKHREGLIHIGQRPKGLPGDRIYLDPREGRWIIDDGKP